MPSKQLQNSGNLPPIPVDFDEFRHFLSILCGIAIIDLCSVGFMKLGQLPILKIFAAKSLFLVTNSYLGGVGIPLYKNKKGLNLKIVLMFRAELTLGFLKGNLCCLPLFLENVPSLLFANCTPLNFGFCRISAFSPKFR